MSFPSLSPEKQAALRKAFQDGWEVNKICAELGVARGTVWAYTKDLPRRRVSRGQVISTRQRDQAIAALLQAGLTQDQISAALHVSPTTICAVRAARKKDPMPQLGTRVSDALLAELKARGDHNTVAREALERYFQLLRHARRNLRAGLTPDEQAAIVAGFSSTPVDDQMRYGRYVTPTGSAPLLVAHLEDCIRHEVVTFEQFDFQPVVFLAKLSALDDLHIVALLDAVERFWFATRQDAERDPRRMLEE